MGRGGGVAGCVTWKPVNSEKYSMLTLSVVRVVVQLREVR